MQLHDKIITSIPINEISLPNGKMLTHRKRYLTKSDIKSILQQHPVPFIVADIGDKLKWINVSVCFNFWKTEAEMHIVDDFEKIDIKNFPGGYAYMASEWESGVERLVILLEKYH